jgi:glycosyltransferase involved in cell wall biosynthesis
MKILICHERFLFRFGADRVLLLLARGLSQLGHRITLAGNRFDKDVADAFVDRIIETPADLGPYLDLNELTEYWLRGHWNRLFPEGTGPDVVIVGGWPFITSIPFLRQCCRHVIFIDFGVVPMDGYPEAMTVTLKKLHKLRADYVKQSSMVIGISAFIVNTQSRIEAGGATQVRSVLLGADHVDMSIWPGSQVAEASAGRSLGLLHELKREGKKTILCLGRWEPGCYKNSQAAFEVLDKILSTEPDCCLLILEKDGRVTPPPHLAKAVVPIGFPDDAELNEVMRQSDLGISMSLWEGFNLPLAEMQWLGRPALVFNVGAHSEVVAHPWYLCSGVGEMAVKARAVLRNEGLDGATASAALDRFRQAFTWKRFIDKYAGILNEMEQGVSYAVNTSKSVIVIDVTNSAKDPGNPGVIRVTRRLSRELQQHTNPIFVVWDDRSGQYVLPTVTERTQLSQFNGPLLENQPLLSKNALIRTTLDELLTGTSYADTWLLLPETLFETEFARIRRFAHSKGFGIGAIFYDAIPVLQPDLCNDAIRNNHASYMRGLAECDVAIPISQFSGDCLQQFWAENGVGGQCRITTNLLPGEFAGTARNLRAETSHADVVRILCVSTLEPRKNQRNLILACLLMQKQHPELYWSLTLIGNRYDGAPEIVEFVERTAASNPRVRWLGVVDDVTLNKCYIDSWFTVYASTIEGFGLPIMESIWNGRPCICHRSGVMAELAGGGGCLTTDVTDPASLGESIYRLATDTVLRERLSSEAKARPLKTWSEYACGVMEAMGEVRPQSAARPAHIVAGPAAIEPRGWKTILYKNCLCDGNWQMNDSERMALTGLLARHKPNCSIEVGTYLGGSLSLMSQFSNMVFSVDIDPEVPQKFAYFENVSFLTGNSSVLLPHLFEELDRSGIAVDFVLIDADHTAEGIRRDIQSVLRYVPRKPMFIMLHDSFNPECRRGMLAANWESSPYCHWVDLDFIPGRIIEHGGGGNGELWGGLATAYFDPAQRSGPLTVQTSADNMFQALR